MPSRFQPLLLLMATVALLLPRSVHATPDVAPEFAATPWRALGRVQTELGTRCTGFLIAPALVMTAAHCLYRPVTGHYVQPNSVHFLLRYDHGRFAGHATAITFVISPGYDPTEELSSLGLDRAFLTLDHAVGTEADTVRFAPTLPPRGATIATGGYNRDHDEVLEIGTCHLLGYRADLGGHRLIQDDCPGEPGSSGAALFAQQPDGSWAVIGMAVARTGRNGRHGLAEPLAP
ncbi:MAG TPA: serine protease [Acidisoma sp.]|uniref:trypsin-like serine peptidase n=1 Tax=Acidisoma sp. TaxID=1872115 RepID=UPI002B883775|nr:serine protease [Acidisoma sp.]HTI01173.1 serine protease [Acidisoma sp.]